MEKRTVILSFVFVIAMASLSLKRRPSENKFQPALKLSEYNFFTGPLAALQPASGVTPYDLNSPLFSNYAEKLRFIKLPDGAKASYTDNGALQFPKGTIVIKNFYYPSDFRHAANKRKILETRLMINEDYGWAGYPYIWNDEQTDAIYSAAGGIKNINYTNTDGKQVNTIYVIPNKNQCRGCHLQNNSMVLIGPTAAQMNKEYEYNDGKENQLMYWQQHDLITRMPDLKSIPKLPRWQDATQPLAERARAYLDINCGNCHHPQGPANTSGLFLHYSQPLSVELGIMKSPVAAGRGSGNNKFDIVPGKPEKSILIHRMETNDPGVAMPELGREQIHKEGVSLIREWIKSMKG